MFDLGAAAFPVREGQRVRIGWGNLQGRERGPYLFAGNHNTNHVISLQRDWRKWFRQVGVIPMPWKYWGIIHLIALVPLFAYLFRSFQQFLASRYLSDWDVWLALFKAGGLWVALLLTASLIGKIVWRDPRESRIADEGRKLLFDAFKRAD